MTLKRRLAKLEMACLSVKPKVRVVFIVLKKDHQANEGLLEYMQTHGLSERPQKCIFFEIVDAQKPRPQT